MTLSYIIIRKLWFSTTMEHKGTRNRVWSDKKKHSSTFCSLMRILNRWNVQIPDTRNTNYLIKINIWERIHVYCLQASSTPSRPGLKVIYYVVLLLDCILIDICNQKEPLKAPRNLTPNRFKIVWGLWGDRRPTSAVMPALWSEHAQWGDSR